MIRVGVNGYGTIGKRVADAVAAQPDMELAGVTKASPDYGVEAAARRDYALYAAVEDRADEFAAAGVDLAGTLGDLLDAVDVVVDCAPSGVGERNAPVYEAHDTPAIFQGGEDVAVADASFNARGRFEAARGADSVRVVSCNTTALSRLLAPLDETYGVEKARVTLVRRGGDPSETDRGPINDIVPDPATVPSHHGPDVNEILPDLAVDTAALRAPVTAMHTHSVNVTLETDPDSQAVRDLLAGESRIFLVPEAADVDGAGALKEYAADAGRPRGDLWENCVWEESISVAGRDLYLFQNVHQEADVVPENVDAIRAMATDVDAAESIARTNETLGVGLDSRLGGGDAAHTELTADD
ncbi:MULTISPECIES: type II glyceraldehyde-3-phosphate dehydrogenase [Halorubrum]|uniref:Glyceraldehyde-3-phosphate dehydrogenase n=1 Tax=Halorubrum sodomense TaxID=35743 RepID=A0A1I6HVQ4_HALSD|nr:MULTISPECIES: type II glyceraldehyde-3-phosphate dehydrogenase [Halorubrum]TKX54416.1 type II glyceraldehyde-3-phosphate dehydrogenase [Halorubrum sp. SP3]TKX70877.1 type II glyceraldehyde-3-phosphate dehydrogenase [Halorubrum sp. SP9]SFR58525.1 glyceraldehyde-3-phosphate dehydrogenase (NAD(P)) [Halorubrum sodomense]